MENWQDEWDDKLCDMIEFSEDEAEEEGGLTIKNASRYLQYKPPKKKGIVSNKVDESKYFEAIAKQAPNLDKAAYLKKTKKKLMEDFRHRQAENASTFAGDL